MNHHHFLAGYLLRRRWGPFGADPYWEPFVQVAKHSEVEGVLLPGFGNVGLERPRDVGGDEWVTAGKCHMGTELLLNPLVGRELAQALGDLPVLFDREEPQAAVSWAEHEVVRLPYLLWGGSEWGDGVGKARPGKFLEYAVEAAFVVADGGHLDCMGVDFGIPEDMAVVVGRWVDGIFVSRR